MAPHLGTVNRDRPCLTDTPNAFDTTRPLLTKVRARSAVTRVTGYLTLPALSFRAHRSIVSELRPACHLAELLDLRPQAMPSARADHQISSLRRSHDGLEPRASSPASAPQYATTAACRR